MSRALAIDPANAEAHSQQSWILQYRRKFDQATAEAERAIEIDPSNMSGYNALCAVNTLNGHPDKVFQCAEKEMRLSPRDPLRFSWLDWVALAHFQLGQYTAALDSLRRSLSLNPQQPAIMQAYVASLLALTGQEAQAQDLMTHYLAMPEAQLKTIAALKKMFRSSNEPVYLAFHEHFWEGLRRAGMPEQ